MKLNALDLLLADPGHATAAITRALTVAHVLDELPRETPPLAAPAAKFLLGAVAGALETMLAAIGLDALLTSGWQQLDSVAKARAATADDHGERHVSLLHHEVTSHHEPKVEMLVDELPVPLMDLRLDASFVIEGCGLLVRDGEIASATPVAVSATGELACGDVTVLKHSVAQLDPARLFAGAVRTG
jgi:hypothetical protein